MAKVIVGISGNEKEMPVMSGLKYVSVPKALADSVKEAGGLPIVIPVGDPSLAKEYVDMVDKLILSGGQNIDPRFYGEEKTVESDDYSLARDRFELALIKEALKQNKPIFAVCRGMQLLNVALGGTINQEVLSHWQDSLEGTSHTIQIKKGSQMARFFSSGSPINSIHHQAIKELAPELVATARDPRDGTIEAYESRTGRPLLGIQWHPEFLCKECPANQSLFTYLVHTL